MLSDSEHELVLHLAGTGGRIGGYIQCTNKLYTISETETGSQPKQSHAGFFFGRIKTTVSITAMHGIVRSTARAFGNPITKT